MRALLLLDGEGEPQLNPGETTDPVAGPGEVLVGVEAAGLNHVDVLLAQGRLGLQPRLPHIPGIEGAGTIAAVGAGVPESRIGERVTIYPYQGCGRCLFCYAGEEQVCPVGQSTCIGLTLPGTFAERVVVREANAIRIPEDVSPDSAAASTVAGMTAYRLVITRGGVRTGETVLVRAVGSGVGVMAAQLARTAGARVIGTAGTDEKLKQARRLGIEHTVNHTTEDVPLRVKELTHGQGADLIVDYVGSATWTDNLRCLSRGGRLVLCGAHTGTKVDLDLWHLFAKEHTITGSYGGTRQELIHTLRLIREGSLTPFIQRSHSLEEAGTAFNELANRHVFGKIILKPDRLADLSAQEAS